MHQVKTLRGAALSLVAIASLAVLSGCKEGGGTPSGDTRAKYMERMKSGQGNQTGPGRGNQMRPGIPAGVPGGGMNAPGGMGSNGPGMGR